MGAGSCQRLQATVRAMGFCPFFVVYLVWLLLLFPFFFLLLFVSSYSLPLWPPLIVFVHVFIDSFLIVCLFDSFLNSSKLCLLIFWIAWFLAFFLIWFIGLFLACWIDLFDLIWFDLLIDSCLFEWFHLISFLFFYSLFDLLVCLFVCFFVWFNK